MYTIAEIGFNHEGDMDVASRMIRAASHAGANAVKFQTYRAIDLALPSAPHYKAIQCGEMDLEQHQQLAGIARTCGMDFLSTPFSPWAIEILEQIDVPAYKVASMDCTNTQLLCLIAQTKKPIYLSTGMATLAEIEDMLNFLSQKHSGAVSLLHCVSLYPANAEDLNLNIIPLLKNIFGVPVGYSDHYPGIKACFAAAMLGAEVIETHFTLDTTKPGGDHAHSADPEMLQQLLSEIALFRKMKGRERAIHNRPDRQWAAEFRRGVYTAHALHKGDTIAEKDLLFCRPTSKFSPGDVEWLKGKLVSQNIDRYQAIDTEMLKQ